MKTLVFPLSNSRENFDTVEDYIGVVKQNIISLILTDSGERVIRRKQLGFSLRKLFFENDRESAISLLKTGLQEHMNKYFPSIKISSVTELDKEANANTTKISIFIEFVDTQLNIPGNLTIRN